MEASDRLQAYQPLSSKMTVGLSHMCKNVSLRLSRIAAKCSDPKSASEIIKICNELVDNIEVLEKVFKSV